MDVERLKELMDYLGGAKDDPPPGFKLPRSSWMWGAWWAALTLVIVFFSGQVSKFIYIDF